MIPVNLDVAASFSYNSWAEHRDLHHRNESSYRNNEQEHMIPTQEGRTPEQWPHDGVDVDSEVGEHIGFGGAFHIRIRCVEAIDSWDRKTQIELNPDGRGSGGWCLRLRECPRRAGGIQSRLPFNTPGTSS